MPPTHKFLWEMVSKELDRCEAKNKQLEEALRFYADEENWYGYEHIEGPAVARDALSPSEAPEEEE